MFKKIIITVLILFPFSSFAQFNELSIVIDVNTKIPVNENLEFSYSIKSITNIDVQYIPKIECPNVPSAMLGVLDLHLQTDRIYEDKYFSMKISEDIEPQECTAIIDIIEPFQQKQEKKFKIVTNPSFDIEILLCKDQECQNKSRVYKKNEYIYMDYKTEIFSEIEVAVEILFPNGVLQQVVLPNNIILDQIGNYIIEVNAVADSYKKNIQSFPITVLESDIKVNDKRICNSDARCQGDENVQNCPQDCRETILDKNKSTVTVYSVVILIFSAIIVLIGMIFFKKTRKKDF